MLRQFNPLVRSQARVTHVVSYNVKSRLRFSSSSRQYAKQNKYHSALYLALFGGTFAVVSYFISDNPIHNDGNMQMEPDSKPSKKNQNTHGLDLEDEHLTTLIWGSNRSGLISPDTPEVETFRSPFTVRWLEDVALRDLALHEHHGACVDARGDVYQWGDAYYEKEAERLPTLSLKDKNIVKVELTQNRVFALSSSGKIYVLSADAKSQKIDPPRTDSSWLASLWTSGAQTVDYNELTADQKFGRGEKFVSISAGNDHLLALTSNGRTFAYPISKHANTYGQLGFRKFSIPKSSTTEHRVDVELVPKAIADPYARVSPYERGGLPSFLPPTSFAEPPPPPPPAANPTPSSNIVELENESIRFCDRLFEIPSLRGIKIAQAVAGARTSFVRTENDGRVLAWGANEHGQLGLGSFMTLDTVTIPTEVVFTKSAPSGTRSKCSHIGTGGDLSFFIVERRDGTFMPTADLLACGMGQYGGLGNGLFSTAQGSPLRVKAVSGLQEFSEVTQNLQPIVPYALSASPTGHVLLTLDTLARSGPGTPVGSGRDLLVWGANRDFQLGNGKRASLATPSSLELPGLPNGIKVEGEDETKGRLMMMKRRAKEVKDMQGRKWKSNVEVEQCAVAGWGSSLIYWKVCGKS